MHLDGENLAVIEDRDGVNVASFVTDSLFDPLAVDHVGGQLRAALAAGGPDMVVAFEGIKHIGSSMLSVLIHLREDAAKRDGRICLAAVPAPIQQLLEVAQFDQFFESFPTVDDAVATLQ